MTIPEVARYDKIGSGYADLRRADWRIADAIEAHLGGAEIVLNVGAGAGSYEPTDRSVVAIEPSATMVKQRAPGTAPVVRGLAGELPFAAQSFDVAMAVLTIHHWPDHLAGLREMRRVARNRVVILTWDPSHEGFWLVRDYFPDLLALDRTIFPRLDEFRAVFPQIAVHSVLVPGDCTDGFLGAYWKRPRRLLDPSVRGAISSFSRINDVDARLRTLARELEDGTWARRNENLTDLGALDVGYRLVVADLAVYSK